MRPSIRKTLATSILVAGASIMAPASATAQTDLGLRAGGARGSTASAVLELTARRVLIGRLAGAARVQAIQAPFPCDAIWPDSYRCAFGGWGADVGPALSLVRSRRATLDLVTMAGVFRRTSHRRDRETSLAWSLGTDGSAMVGEGWGIAMGVHHKRVRDYHHRQLIGQDARATAVTVGAILRF